MKSNLHQIALNLMPDIGPVTVRNLVSYCGGVSEIFEASKSDLDKIPGIGPARNIYSLRDEALKMAEAELRIIEENSIQTLFYLDKKYPKRLNEYHDSPIILYVKGEVDFNKSKILAVVGTRTPSDYGKMKCEQIVEDLKAAGVTIVSGLAYGIDSVAHRSSVRHNMQTIAVLGNGLPAVYPRDNKPLAKQILDTNGALVSQFPCNAKPDRERFPIRNKTVAYMTDATLVIESKGSGGSMITANFAFHNHKELFAVPGRTTDVNSEGCNKLIKANLAQLVTDGSDILKSMMWDSVKPRAVQSSLILDISDDFMTVVKVIRNQPDIHIDALSAAVNLSHADLASALLQLELQGIIKQSVGKRYVVIA